MNKGTDVPETTPTTEEKPRVRASSGGARGSKGIKLTVRRRRPRADSSPKPEAKTASVPTPDPATPESEREHAQKRLEEAKKRIEAQEAKKIEDAQPEPVKPETEAAPEPQSDGGPPETEAGPQTGGAKTAEAAEGEDASGRKRGKGRSEQPRRTAGRGDRGGPRRPRRLKVTDALDQEDRQRSLAAIRRRQERERRLRQQASGGQVERAKVYRDVQIPDTITVHDLANRMAEPSSAVIRALMAMGQPATINAVLDGDTAELIVREFKHRPTRVSASDIETGLGTAEDPPETRHPRAPVVAVMGHVDHGKTSLLDMIRKANVASGEAGAITQHIGAYRVELPDSDGDAQGANRHITFLDTPGHAAFSSMRARGAQVTDLVVLVVAANEGLKPQTDEAIDHARAAGVPVVVAINKTDLEGADPDRVRDELLRKDVIVEKRGGEILDTEVSAKTGEGIPALLESILLRAELLDLTANPDRPAEGIVVEAKLERGRGPVATVLVGHGTLRRRDHFVVGAQWGRVRELRNEDSQILDRAGPSIPVEIDGLQGIPEAGDKLVVVETDSRAREIAEHRQGAQRPQSSGPSVHASNIDLLTQARAEQASGEPGKLQVVVKADVRGSAEAIVEALGKIGNESVSVQTLSHGVGDITESDINLAIASDARIFRFNVGINAQAKELARRSNVAISNKHSIIYELVNEATQLASGMLAPEIRETVHGTAEVAEVFSVSKIGSVAGCRVTDGVARQDSKARLLRDGEVIYTGTLATLKRFKDSVPEVRAGTECGISLQNQPDIRPGDLIEMFTTTEVERTL